MWKASFIAFALVVATAAVSGAALAADYGRIVRVLRPTVRVFDAKGQPAGTVNASDIKTPAPIVGLGVGGSFGVNVHGKVVYLRGLDVQTDGVRANCKPVESASRNSGTSYAATNAGLGGASDCSGH
jgi:hypothetical protein